MKTMKARVHSQGWCADQPPGVDYQTGSRASFARNLRPACTELRAASKAASVVRIVRASLNAHAVMNAHAEVGWLLQARRPGGSPTVLRDGGDEGTAPTRKPSGTLMQSPPPSRTWPDPSSPYVYLHLYLYIYLYLATINTCSGVEWQSTREIFCTIVGI